MCDIFSIQITKANNRPIEAPRPGPPARVADSVIYSRRAVRICIDAARCRDRVQCTRSTRGR